MRGWRCTPEWAGGHCFIIGGGPSVLKQNLELLRPFRVIVVNSSFETYPQADFLIFSDSRWWYHNQKWLLKFKGRIVSTSSTAVSPKLLRMNRGKPPRLSKDAGTVSIQFTTMVAALNLAMHLGVKSICLLGADGKAAEDGRTHHHTPHPWRVVPGCWEKQRADLAGAASDLKAAGIYCVNASPGSAWADLWPIVDLEEFVNTLEAPCSDTTRMKSQSLPSMTMAPC